MAEITAQVNSSIQALMQEFSTITHNLANVSTPGFKRRCNAFAKSLQAQDLAQENTPAEITLDCAYDFSQGSITHTGRTLDFALHGNGFFVIETPEGPLYTRNGMFRTNQNGQIVNSEGNLVAGQNGPITIPPNVPLSQLYVTNDGTLSATDTTIGKFRIVDFNEDRDKLQPAGQTAFKMPDQDIKPETAQNVIVKQGFQEASNVKMVEELVDMIMVARLYEANMKFVSTEKQTSQSILKLAMG